MPAKKATTTKKAAPKKAAAKATTAKKAAPKVKSVEEVAKEVIAGDWGIGQERRNRLQQAGFNPADVQKAVVHLLNP